MSQPSPPFSAAMRVTLVHALALVIALLLCLLSVSHLSNLRQGCTLPRMRPWFSPLRVSGGEHLGYSAWAYSEGGAFDFNSSWPSRCIPAIFVPGQAGSFKQVRSLAKESSLMGETGSRRLCWIAVHLNEELAFLDPGLLSAQAAFVAASTREVSRATNRRAVLVGHSAGAIAARLAALHEPNSVDLVVSLAGPFRATSLVPSPSGAWLLHRASAHSSGMPPTVSICGGRRDVQAPEWVCGLAPSNDSAWASAPVLPGVKASPDHKSIVWCLELVREIVRHLHEGARVGNFDQVVLSLRAGKPAAFPVDGLADVALFLAPKCAALSVARLLGPPRLRGLVFLAACGFVGAVYSFIDRGGITRREMVATGFAYFAAGHVALGSAAVVSAADTVMGRVKGKLPIAVFLACLSLLHPSSLALVAWAACSGSSWGPLSLVLSILRVPSVVAWACAARSRPIVTLLRVDWLDAACSLGVGLARSGGLVNVPRAIALSAMIAGMVCSVGGRPDLLSPVATSLALGTFPQNRRANAPL